jgi:hypothetical protein
MPVGFCIILRAAAISEQSIAEEFNAYTEGISSGEKMVVAG